MYVCTVVIRKNEMVSFVLKRINCYFQHIPLLGS